MLRVCIAMCSYSALLPAAVLGQFPPRECGVECTASGAPKPLQIAGLDAPATLLLAVPWRLSLGPIAASFDAAEITDLELLDFDLDGRKDIAVSWYKTDFDNPSTNARVLSLFLNRGVDDFARVDINLYVPFPGFDVLSVFRHGPADMGIGDFDNDGDPDIAVTPFFGDEIWFIENRRGGDYVTHLKYMFGFNGTDPLTPPECAVADFDGDGRVDLAYVADPYQRTHGKLVHFWRTSSTIANMTPADWDVEDATIALVETRSIAVADFDRNGRPDLCIAGQSILEEPAMAIWANLNPSTGLFTATEFYTDFRPSDVEAIRVGPSCRPALLLGDLDGSLVEYWAPVSCDGPIDLVPDRMIGGLSGLSPNRGMTLVVGDLNGDGLRDFVARQKLGAMADPDQLDAAVLGIDDGRVRWTLLQPTPMDTTGFRYLASNAILRPRNLAIGDLVGNTLPEVVAAFGLDPDGNLDIGIWLNSCVGDVTRDGATTMDDLTALLSSSPCRGTHGFNPNADLNKDGCINVQDFALLLADFGCRCCGED